MLVVTFCRLCAAVVGPTRLAVHGPHRGRRLAGRRAGIAETLKSAKAAMTDPNPKHNPLLV